MSTWSRTSWRTRPANQQPDYPDQERLGEVLEELRQLPPLVVADEVEQMRTMVAEAAEGKRFMLQGGDCAERFEDCRPETIAAKLRVLLQMSVVISHGGRVSVFHVGRIAGQYGKPRSSAMECVGDMELPSYRGDLVNAAEPTLEARTPDPTRLLKAYFRSAATLNYLRSLVDGGYADIHHPERWELPWDGEEFPAYHRILAEVQDSVDFVRALGGVPSTVLRTGDIFTSHEALHLSYEESLTRQDGPSVYNLGAHMLWVGERTRDLEGAHIEYLRGLRNPLGVKLGPSVTPDELRRILERLDPNRERGRLVLIPRFGAAKVEAQLPPLVRAVQEEGYPVLWSCDPMHGNGWTTSSGLKTRRFEDILSELRTSMTLHRSLGSRLGAVHFELTGEHVTECLGGGDALVEADLQKAYQSGCDPRLNRNQSLEMAFLIAQMLRESRKQ
jgi:3-deoxy-7-phosphoheptulonate synthase